MNFMQGPVDPRCYWSYRASNILSPRRGLGYLLCRALHSVHTHASLWCHWCVLSSFIGSTLTCPSGPEIEPSNALPRTCLELISQHFVIFSAHSLSTRLGQDSQCFWLLIVNPFYAETTYVHGRKMQTKKLKKTSKPCHVGIPWKALAEC